MSIWLWQARPRRSWRRRSSCAGRSPSLIAAEPALQPGAGRLGAPVSTVARHCRRVLRRQSTRTACSTIRVMTGILFGSTMPSFWLGLLLILVFSVQLDWFPVSGARQLAIARSAGCRPSALGGMALVARVTRVAMIETAQKGFRAPAARQGRAGLAHPGPPCAAPCTRCPLSPFSDCGSAGSWAAP